jgi:hypothetical protein
MAVHYGCALWLCIMAGAQLTQRLYAGHQASHSLISQPRPQHGTVTYLCYCRDGLMVRARHIPGVYYVMYHLDDALPSAQMHGSINTQSAVSIAITTQSVQLALSIAASTVNNTGGFW